MKRISWVLLILFLGSLGQLDCFYPNPLFASNINPVASYEGEEDEDLSNVQVPIPFEDRVPNRTGIQCVWCSFETIARYAQEIRLYDLTRMKEYQSYAGPGAARTMLERFNIKYEMTTKGDRNLLIKGCQIERRGAVFSIPGHMMTMVHYDERIGVIKYINNSDPQLKIRTWSMNEFNKRWDGWAAIIYAKEDIIPNKYRVFELPIIDRNVSQREYSKDYVLMPRK